MERKRILLAEDDENLGTLLKNYLAAKGYDVELYADGQKALGGFRAGNFSISIVDVMMPVMDGCDMVQAWTRRTSLRVGCTTNWPGSGR